MTELLSQQQLLLRPALRTTPSSKGQPEPGAESAKSPQQQQQQQQLTFTDLSETNSGVSDVWPQKLIMAPPAGGGAGQNTNWCYS